VPGVDGGGRRRAAGVDGDPADTQAIGAAVAALPRLQRQVVVAACARHLTFADIAGRLGVSEADVRRALADGLQGVRARWRTGLPKGEQRG
jgi:DNA-directed RNA polymerase specialized sigma24 family protein